MRLVRRRGMGISVGECSRACLIRLIDFPELPLRSNIRETLKSGRSSLVVKAEIALGWRTVTVAYKRFRRRNWWKSLTGMLRPRRALRNWRLSELLRREGICTPQALVAVVPRGAPDRVDSYLATEWVEGVSLYQFPRWLASMPAARQGGLLHAAAERIGRLLGRLHGAGFTHRDLKPGNLMLAGNREDVDTLQAHLIDLDGVKRHASVGRRERAKDLSRLAVGLSTTTGLTPAVCLRFVKAYLAHSGDRCWCWKDCWAELAEATERRRLRRTRRRAA